MAKTTRVNSLWSAVRDTTFILQIGSRGAAVLLHAKPKNVPARLFRLSLLGCWLRRRL